MILALQDETLTGKFQGVRQAATPSGCLNVRTFCFGFDEGTTSPYVLSLSS